MAMMPKVAATMAAPNPVDLVATAARDEPKSRMERVRDQPLVNILVATAILTAASKIANGSFATLAMRN